MGKEFPRSKYSHYTPLSPSLIVLFGGPDFNRRY